MREREKERGREREEEREKERTLGGVSESQGLKSGRQACLMVPKYLSSLVFHLFRVTSAAILASTGFVCSRVGV